MHQKAQLLNSLFAMVFNWNYYTIKGQARETSLILSVSKADTGGKWARLEALKKRVKET